MTWIVLRRSFLVSWLIAGLLLTSPPAAPLSAQGLEAIAANDNRLPAGQLRNGVLSLQLELRKGLWHPERETGEAIPVYAFGEAAL